jgi:hypothetical protein
VTRSRAERPVRTGLVRFGTAMTVGAVAGTVLLLVALIASALGLPVVVGVIGGMLGLLLMAGGSAGGIILNHSFAPGTDTDRVFWFTGGLARLTATDPEARILPWDDVDSVVATLLDEAFQHHGWYYTCTLRGRTGTEITLTGYDKATVGNALGRRVVNEAVRLLGPRVVPPLIEAYERGEPASIGGWRVDRTGISASESGFVTGSCSWSAVTRVTMQRVPPKTGPIEQIHVYTGRRQSALDIGLSDIPNGFFLPALIAHAAASNGIAAEGGPAEEQRLPPADRSSGLMSPPG